MEDYNLSIWPEQFIQNTGDIQGLSALPIIWLMGKREVGKSSFVATIDPVRPGNKSRTLITDLEMSYNTIRTQVPLDVINIREETFKRIGKEYTFKDLFLTWKDIVLDVEAGQYTVLGVDPVSDLFQGAFQFVGENAYLFGKTPQRYNGEMGNKAQWGDTALYWKQLSLELAQRYETTVFVSHLKDVFKNNVRTGQQAARGSDFSEVASLVLWLNREGSNFEAIVMKSRLSWYDWGDEKENRSRPILRELLPRRLVPEYSGQPYPELIYNYMASPQSDYGELDIVKEDPTIEKISIEEQQQINLQLSENLAKVKIAEGRKQMMQDLIDNGYYESEKEIARVAKANNVIYNVEEHDKIYTILAGLSNKEEE